MKMKLLTGLLLMFVAYGQTQQDSLSTAQAWGFGILAGAGLSILGVLAAIVIISIKRFVTDQTFKFVINMLYGLGCGAMIGDAMIHILPQAYSHQAANKNIVSLIFISAICIFLIIQRIFVACGIAHTHWGDDGHTSCGGSQAQIHNQIVVQQNSEPAIQPSESNEECCQCLKQLKGKKSSGYLVFVSSFIHIFFDGFAIGVGFASRQKTQYVSVVVAIFAHEIPSQMGHVGILMKSRFNNCQTLLCNTFVNITSMIGVVIGLGLGELGEETQIYILAFVAGNFIYIGTDIWRNLMKRNNIKQNVLESFSFFLGVGAMYLVLMAQN